MKARDLLECIRRLEHQNTNETARRVLQSCGQILRYAIVTARAEIDISHHLRGALAPINTKHLASVRSPKEAGAPMRAIEGYDGRMVTRFALRLAPLVFVRPFSSVATSRTRVDEPSVGPMLTTVRAFQAAMTPGLIGKWSDFSSIPFAPALNWLPATLKASSPG